MTLIYFLATFGFLCALPAAALLSIVLTRRAMDNVPGQKSTLAKDGPGPDIFAPRKRGMVGQSRDRSVNERN